MQGLIVIFGAIPCVLAIIQVRRSSMGGDIAAADLLVVTLLARVQWSQGGPFMGVGRNAWC